MVEDITDDMRKQAGLFADLYGAIIAGLNKRGLKSPPVTLIEAFLAVCVEEGLRSRNMPNAPISPSRR